MTSPDHHSSLHRHTALSRRTVLAGFGAAAPIALMTHAASASTVDDVHVPATAEIIERIRTLETKLHGTIAVDAFNVRTGHHFGYRSDQRVLLCSVSKVLVVATALWRSQHIPGFLNQEVLVRASDILLYSPVTQQHVGSTLTIKQLCEAALTTSDNTASNLVMAHIGGPQSVTRFVRNTGDFTTRLDRTEPDLNKASGALDTTTVRAFSKTLEHLVLGCGYGARLGQTQRDLLAMWMKNSTTGAKQIRAGLPADVVVGDKTGAGLGHESNDVAVIWPASGGPVVMSVFTKSDHDDVDLQRSTIAAVAEAVWPAVKK